MSNYKVKDIYEFLHFSSIMAFVRHCDQDQADSYGKPSHALKSDNPSFYASDNYDEASKLILSGWKKGVRDLQQAIEICSDGMDLFEANQPIMDVVGPIPITGAYCSGDPECMMTPAAPEMNPVINIVFDLAVNCGIGYETLMNRGAAILALAKQLEVSGKRVAIYAASVVDYASPMRNEKMSRKDGTLHTFIVCLKQPELDFNLHSLSYALANVDMFRRHGFRLYEKSEKTPESHGSGHAKRLDEIEGIDNAMVNVDLYFPLVSSEHEYRNAPAAIETVLNIAREAEVIT